MGGVIVARELAIENGKLKSNLDANGNKVANLAPPTSDGDAATKKYVDERPVPPSSWSDITGKPDTFPPEAHTHTKSEITDFPTEMPPTAHSHANDGWFTTAIEAVKVWANGAFAAITHSHASDSWFTTALGGKINKTYGTATDLTVIEPLTIESYPSGRHAVFSVGGDDGILYISGLNDINVENSERTLYQINDKLNELDDGKANASDFSTSTPASYVTDFVQQSATLQAQIKSVAQSLIRTAVANFDPDEQSFADLVNILKNIGA